jgi:MFS family permease
VFSKISYFKKLHPLRKGILMARKNKILAYMGLSIFLGSLPWYNFSAVVSYIAAEVHLTTSEIGLIISAFQAGYVLVVVFTSWLADRIGAKWVVTGATLLAGVFSTLFALLGNSLVSILILRVLSGAASGAIYVPGLALLSQWFAPHERTRALGAYTGALVAAYAGGYFIAGPVAASFGWRLGVFVTSIPALAGFLISYFLVEENAEHQKNLAALRDGGSSMSSPSKAYTTAGPTGILLPLLITISYMGHMWELFAFWGWLGPFLMSSFVSAGMDTQTAISLSGRLAALIILVGVPSCLFWGMAADRFGRVKCIVIASIFSLLANCMFGFLHSKNTWLVIILGAWIGFWVVADTAIYKALLTEVVPVGMMSTSLGIQSVSGFGMSAVAPVIFGNLLHFYNGPASTMEASIWWPSFLSLGVGALFAPVFALIFHWVYRSKIRTHTDRMKLSM